MIGLLFQSLWYDSQERKFYNIQIPKGEYYQKPIEFLSYNQIDSIENLKVNSTKIEVIGTGYSGYNFYIWHKPTEKGKIFIKAFEITQNHQLSEQKLKNGTQHSITELLEEYKLYKGKTVIDEGTFERYYPVRFELWFKAAQDGKQIKLAESFYLIDGWDR